MSSNNPNCSKCGCSGYIWNPISAGQKLFSGGSLSLGGSSFGLFLPGQPTIDNKSSQAAYRNCMCGHHSNYHK